MHLAGDSGPQATNGVGRAVYHLAHAQRTLGHEVGIVCERAEHVEERDTVTSSNRRCSPSGCGWRGGRDHISPALVRELLDNPPDIVHLHSIHVPENVSLSRAPAPCTRAVLRDDSRRSQPSRAAAEPNEETGDVVAR